MSILVLASFILLATPPPPGEAKATTLAGASLGDDPTAARDWATFPVNLGDQTVHPVLRCKGTGTCTIHLGERTLGTARAGLKQRAGGKEVVFRIDWAARPQEEAAKYGQCWVFAGLCVTRAVWTPTEAMVRQLGTWNFHVWNHGD